MKRLKTISESIGKINEDEESNYQELVPLAQLGDLNFWKIKTEDDYIEWWAKEMGQSVEELKESEPTIVEAAKKAVEIVKNSKMLDVSEALPVTIPTADVGKYKHIYVGDDGGGVYVIATDLENFGDLVSASM